MLNDLIPELDKLSGPTGWSILRGRMPGDNPMYIVNVRAGGQFITSEAAATLVEAETRALLVVQKWIKQQERIAREMVDLLQASVDREKARKPAR